MLVLIGGTEKEEKMINDQKKRGKRKEVVLPSFLSVVSGRTPDVLMTIMMGRNKTTHKMVTTSELTAEPAVSANQKSLKQLLPLMIK